MKLPLAIYGAGGLGRELSTWIRRKEQYDLIGFIDDNIAPGEERAGLPVLDTHPSAIAKNIKGLIFGIAEPVVKQAIFQRLALAGVEFPSIMHDSIHDLDESITVGEGVVITQGVTLTRDIVIGDHAILNINSTVGHDVRLGDFTSIMPGANISGNVQIGPGTLVGSGAVILQGIKIGSNVKVGAGAVVTKNIPDGEIVVGIPARRI